MVSEFNAQFLVQPLWRHGLNTNSGGENLLLEIWTKFAKISKGLYRPEICIFHLKPVSKFNLPRSIDKKLKYWCSQRIPSRRACVVSAHSNSHDNFHGTLFILFSEFGFAWIFNSYYNTFLSLFRSSPKHHFNYLHTIFQRQPASEVICFSRETSRFLWFASLLAPGKFPPSLGEEVNIMAVFATLAVFGTGPVKPRTRKQSITGMAEIRSFILIHLDNESILSSNDYTRMQLNPQQFSLFYLNTRWLVPPRR